MSRPTPRWSEAFAWVSTWLLSAASAHAQADSVHRPVHLDELTVVAERLPVGVHTAVAGVTTIDTDRLRGFWSWPEALLSVPGILVPHRFGSGSPPIVVARGFQGGGETDYVLVTVDGLPRNDPRTGAVQWHALDTRGIERIEVLTGGGSALYGDAAVGATVNALTRVDPGEGARLVGSFGSSGQWAGAASVQHPISNLVADFDGAARRTRGMRRNSAASTANLRAGLSLPGSPPPVRASVYFSTVEQDEPGPLPLREALAHPDDAHESFGADHRQSREAGAAASMMAALDPAWVLSTAGQLRRTWDDQVRTILVAPSFGDTQSEHHRLWDLTLLGVLRSSTAQPAVALGVEVHQTSWRSLYRETSGETLLGQGEGRRTSLSSSLELSRHLTGNVRVLGGARYDYLRVTHRDGMAIRRFSRLSPRIGLNARYRAGDDWGGSGYVLWSRSFKAPTVAQLFDGRTIRAGPGEPISFENPLLQPQVVTGIEVGVTQGVGRHLSVGLTGYDLAAENEIDFDVSTFRYGNISSSRHRGLESSVTARVAGIALRHTTALMSVTSSSEANRGRPLKNLPSLGLSTSLELPVGRSLTAHVAHRLQGRIYLDDENTVRLGPHDTFDVRGSYRHGPATITLSVFNVLDQRQPSLGFLLFDPGTDSNAPYAYPGDARQVDLAIEFTP